MLSRLDLDESGKYRSTIWTVAKLEHLVEVRPEEIIYVVEIKDQQFGQKKS